MAEKTKLYVPKSSAKEIQFRDGGSILKLAFEAETLAEFVKNHANERGWITFGISQRKNVSEYGDTHCVWLDDWKPQPKAAPEAPKQPELPPTDTDDVPY